jgi:hypothetical protein
MTVSLTFKGCSGSRNSSKGSGDGRGSSSKQWFHMRSFGLMGARLGFYWWLGVSQQRTREVSIYRG